MLAQSCPTEQAHLRSHSGRVQRSSPRCSHRSGVLISDCPSTSQSPDLIAAMHWTRYTTVVSALTGRGVARGRGGQARRCPELLTGTRCHFFVMAFEVAGRWSPSAFTFLRNLAWYKSLSVHRVLRRSTQLLFFQRWTAWLVCSIQRACAASLLGKPFFFDDEEMEMDVTKSCRHVQSSPWGTTRTSDGRPQSPRTLQQRQCERLGSAARQGGRPPECPRLIGPDCGAPLSLWPWPTGGQTGRIRQTICLPLRLPRQPIWCGH